MSTQTKSRRLKRAVFVARHPQQLGRVITAFLKPIEALASINMDAVIRYMLEGKEEDYLLVLKSVGPSKKGEVGKHFYAVCVRGFGSPMVWALDVLLRPRDFGRKLYISCVGLAGGVEVWTAECSYEKPSAVEASAIITLIAELSNRGLGYAGTLSVTPEGAEFVD